MLGAETVGSKMADRVSVDIAGLREPLEAVAAQEERNLNQMIRFLLKEGLTRLAIRSSIGTQPLKAEWLQDLDTDEIAALATAAIAELRQRIESNGESSS